MKIKKVFLLNAMMLFHIRNAIVSMFKNGFINPYNVKAPQNQNKY